MQYLAECPVCAASDLEPFMRCEDHTVSHETFHLQQCTACGFVMTNPRPESELLPRYYESDAYISHSDKTRGLTAQVYKIARTFTLRWKVNLVHQHSHRKPKSILDFGCGTGSFLNECNKNKMKISGVEPSPLAREQAIKTTGAAVSPHLNQITGEFDAITLWHVLEHVTDLHETLSELKILLAENGTMFIAVPNLLSLDALQYKAFWAGYDVPRHLWHFSRTTMPETLKKHGLNCIEILPMKLDAYYVSLLSEKYKNGNNNIVNIAMAIYTGWRSNQAAATSLQYSSLIYIVRK